MQTDKPLSLNQAIEYAEREKREDVTPFRRKLVINHEQTANAAIKLVMLTPMPQLIREIMIMRIANPALKRGAMSHLAIAMQLGMREGEVLKLECEGVQIVREYMRKTSLHDGIGKFNKEGNENEVRNIIL
jgi:hypothetical protein